MEHQKLWIRLRRIRRCGSEVLGAQTICTRFLRTDTKLDHLHSMMQLAI
jgi:hypothetical protein